MVQALWRKTETVCARFPHHHVLRGPSPMVRPSRMQGGFMARVNLLGLFCFGKAICSKTTMTIRRSVARKRGTGFHPAEPPGVMEKFTRPDTHQQPATPHPALAYYITTSTATTEFVRWCAAERTIYSLVRWRGGMAIWSVLEKGE